MDWITRIDHYPIVFLILFTFLLRHWIKRRASKMLAQNKAVFSGVLEYAEVSPKDFYWLDLSYYDAMAAKMAQSYFRHVADIESLTATQQFPNLRTFVRCFIGDRGTTMAGIYHIRVRGAMRLLAVFGRPRRDMRIIEFESELMDGTYLITNNGAGLNAFTDYPGFTFTQCHCNTPLEQLLTLHREELIRIITARGVEPRRASSKEDLVAAQLRMHALKSAHKKKIGYIPRAQFERLAGGRLSRDQLKLAEEFERLRDNDKPG